MANLNKAYVIMKVGHNVISEPIAIAFESNDVLRIIKRLNTETNQHIAVADINVYEPFKIGNKAYLISREEGDGQLLVPVAIGNSYEWAEKMANRISQSTGDSTLIDLLPVLIK